MLENSGTISVISVHDREFRRENGIEHGIIWKY